MLNPDFYNKRVEEIMSQADLVVGPTDPLSEALGKMKKYEVQELPVVEKGKLKGLLTFRTLARRRKMPITAQVRSFMISPPKIGPGDRLVIIAEWLINRDFTSLPITHRTNLRGMVSRRDLIGAMKEDPQLRSASVEAVMNFAPTTINGNMGLKKAMNMMDLTRESYVAITDDHDKFLGVVSHKEMLSVLTTPPTKMHKGDFHGEKTHRDRSVASLAMMPKTVTRESNLRDVIEIMLKEKVPTVFIMDGDKLAGSVSEVDIIEVLLREPLRRGPLIQIAGIEDAKLMDAGELNDAILKGVSKVQKHAEVSAVTVRIRHHHHDSDDDKYTVNVKLSTPGEVVARESYDWDLKVAINNAFLNIEKSVKKEIGKKRKR
jgi:CBS domain-containing protein